MCDAFFPGKRIAKDEATFFKCKDRAMYCASCSKNKHGCTLFQFRKEERGPTKAPFLIFRTAVFVSSAPTIYWLSTFLETALSELCWALAKKSGISI